MSTKESEVIEFTETAIVEFKPFERDLVEFNAKYKNNIYDFDDPVQAKQAGTDRITIAHVISALDAEHKKLKAPLKVKTDLIDSERKRIKDALESTRLTVANQIQAHKDKLEEIEADEQAKVDGIYALTQDIDTMLAKQLGILLESVRGISINETFGSKRASAALAKEDTINVLQKAFHAALARQIEQAELETLRKAEAERLQAKRDEEIRKGEAERQEQARKEQEERHERDLKEAKDKAERQKAEARTRETERLAQVEQDKKDAVEKARKNMKAAIEKAENEKQAALDAEKKRVADALATAGKNAIIKAAAEEKRKANRKHRAKVRAEVIEDISKLPSSPNAGKLFDDIDAGNIRHLSIKY